jgi:hypothetical protein
VSSFGGQQAAGHDMLWPLYDSIRCALLREPSQRLRDPSHIKIVHRWRSRRIADLLKLLDKIIRSPIDLDTAGDKSDAQFA